MFVDPSGEIGLLYAKIIFTFLFIIMANVVKYIKYKYCRTKLLYARYFIFSKHFLINSAKLGYNMLICFIYF